MESETVSGVGQAGREGEIEQALSCQAQDTSTRNSQGSGSGALEEMSLLDHVDIYDAGMKVIVSGNSCARVDAVLHQIAREGAKVWMAVRVGQRWVGYFERPGVAECKVNRHGFEIVIHGPSRYAVVLRAGEFIERGATMRGEPQESGGTWTLYLDDIGARTGTMHLSL